MIKSLAFSELLPGEKIYVAPGVALCLAKNFGLGFGLGQDYTRVILILNMIILVFLTKIFIESKGKQRLIWMLILAGGLGNCYDRYFLGYVRDFILLSWNNWSWPIFNIADIYITGAFILLVLPISRIEPSQEFN
jgi:signal peptidase II